LKGMPRFGIPITVVVRAGGKHDDLVSGGMQVLR
jgi:hypothetical protein